MNDLLLYSILATILALTVMFLSWGIVFYVFSIISIFIGFSITLCLWAYLLWLNEERFDDKNAVKWGTGLPGILNCVEAEQLTLPSYNPSGIEMLDSVIEHLTHLIIQDFILKWHDEHYKDKSFPLLLLANMHVIISRFCGVVHDIPWTHICAIKINAIITLHVKLFIKAIKKLDSREPLSKNHPEIIIEFFKAEKSTPNITFHQSICTNSSKEIEYLTFLIESFLYLLLPEIQFDEKCLRYVVRDLLVSRIIFPFIDLVTDPDYINQIIHQLRADATYTNESFISAIRITNSVTDLQELIGAISFEITKLSGKDMDTKEFEEMTKKQITSLLFVKRLCFNQIDSIKQTRRYLTHKRHHSSTPLVSTQSNNSIASLPLSLTLPQIPFKELLENNASFPYLVDYFQEQGDDHLLFLYFGIKDFFEKFDLFLSSQPYLSKSIAADDDILTSLRSDITTLVHTYEKQFDVKNVKFIYKSLFENILREASHPVPSVDSLKALRNSILSYLQEPNYLQRFYSSPKYAKIFIEMRPSAKLQNQQSTEPTDPCSILDYLFHTEFHFDLIISETLLCSQNSQRYFSYVVHVMVLHGQSQYSWKVLRRFRYFSEFRELLVSKFPVFSSVKFPEKRIHSDQVSENLETRKSHLESFLKTLIHHEMFKKNKQFYLMVSRFLDRRVRMAPNNDGDQSPHSSEFSVVPDAADNPDLFFKRDLELALSKHPILNYDYEELESMAMSILVNLIEELFDLRTKTPWLARQIKTFVKDVFIVAYGDRVIRKIIFDLKDYFSAAAMAEYLTRLRDSFWPNNTWAGSNPARTDRVKARERVIATSVLIGSLPTELRRFLGEDVSLDGIQKLFNLLQIQTLNKRLFYTILETVTETLFPCNSYAEIFKNLNEPNSNHT